ncbi:lipid-A-disaccharide synthase [Pedobacter flavus]|uniref:Lipid-A-disaccharide synthase n=1 Tax=Pedobacter flavus TaxID=3113906 RepID=A0ABU7H174_9SPHI|nr:lipid-A-disaccharide synthase [Pedobacter sp. VNH31]MEE1885057.1 lipid-A-disaccharide synthase [Pedobacter sp. VNH31]
MAKYFLVAGEASGDLHGANLIKAIKAKDPQADIQFYGGEKMQAQGGVLLKHYADMAFMGFTEVLMNLRTIFKNMDKCKNDIVAFAPDVLVLIDFPGFNLKIAEFAKKKGIKTCYYISPKVWAWNQKRVLKIKRIVDRMLCILPFEVDFYKEWGYAVDYVGNPLMDEIEAFKKDPHFADKHKINKPIIALLPGSRKQEIERLLPEMLKLVEHYPTYEFVISGAPSFEPSYYDQFINGKPIKLVFNNTYNLVASADAAIVASGTATLETALLKTPQIVVYKGGAISIAIARMVVKIRFISLVNLIVDRKIVTELIQQDFNLANTTEELDLILQGAGRKQMLDDYEALAQRVGPAGASERAANIIVRAALNISI